jgi:hypothetical protein
MGVRMSKYFRAVFSLGKILSSVSCDKKNCINNKEGYCVLANPEKVGNNCLEYEDAMDFFRLKADTARGTLG